MTTTLSQILERANSFDVPAMNASFYGGALYEHTRLYPIIEKFVEVLTIQDEMLKDVIRNSSDIVAKKLCSQTRAEAERMLKEVCGE